MAKIPFSIDYRPQIESGEYKVFAHEHEEQEARIVCWDNKGEYPIVALVDNEPEKFDKYGRVPGGNRGGEFSLFIVTPEEEMSEWQRFISACLQKHGLLDCGAADRIAKESAAELLSLASEQFIKDGYVIEKKAFHDAVEKVDPEVMKEVSENVDKLSKEELTEFENAFGRAMMEVPEPEEKEEWYPFLKEKAAGLLALALKQLQPEIDAEIEKAYKNADDVQYRKGFDDGKAEALKKLPSWQKCDMLDTGQTTVVVGYTKDEDKLYRCGKVITLNDLEKLPGFKEDEK